MAILTPLEVAEILEDSDIATTATIETFASRTYDPTTGIVTETTGTDNTVYIVPPYRVEKYQDGSTVAEGDLVTWFHAYNLGFTPSVGQKLTLDSQVWFISELNSYEGGEGDVVLYEVGLRK